jgi:hypothetical protein
VEGNKSQKPYLMITITHRLIIISTIILIILWGCEKEQESINYNQPIEVTFIIKKLDHLGHYLGAYYCDIEAGFISNSGVGDLSGKADKDGKLTKSFKTDGFQVGVHVTRVWYNNMEYRPKQETLYIAPGESKPYIIYLD